MKHSREKAQEEEQQGKKMGLVLETSSSCPKSRHVEMNNGSLATWGWSSVESQG